MAVLVPSAAAQSAPDAALRALRQGDVHVAARVLGPAGAEAAAVLRAEAARLASRGQPVKLALVPGPVGSPSLRVYALRLRRALGYEGTLVVAGPSSVVAIGPRPLGQITVGLRAIRAGRIANPTERLVLAARVAVPPPTDPGEGGTRSVLLLLGLAALGGAWATALGLSRDARRVGDATLEERAAMRVCLDALRARALILARRPEVTPEARAAVDRALGLYADAVAALAGVRAPGDVRALAPRLLDGLAALADAQARLDGVSRWRIRDPFAELCGVDPAHGAAVAEGTASDLDAPLPLCAACDLASSDGRPPSRRRIPDGCGSLPFTHAAERALGLP